MVTKTKVVISAEDKTKAAFSSARSGLQSINAKVLAVTGAIAGLAGAGGMGLLVKQQLDLAQKSMATARALDMQIESLTAWQSAGKLVNIEGDKMADIFKDVSEKIGEAVTGGGQAAEVLNRLGIEVADIAAMAPDQQLLKIAGALDQLATTGEKVQVLEALASDASLLLPLLDDNAQGFIEARDAAQQYGSALSAVDAQKLQDANVQLDKTNQAIDGIAKRGSASLAPFIERMARGAENLAAALADALDLQPAEERLNELFAERADLMEQMASKRAEVDSTYRQVVQNRIDSVTDEMNQLADQQKQEAQRDSNRRKAEAARKKALEDQIALNNTLKSQEDADKEDQKQNQQIESDIAKLRESLMTKEMVLAEHLQRNEFLIEDAYQQGMVTDAERKLLKEELEAQHQQKLTNLTASQADARVQADLKAQQLQLSSAQTLYGSLEGLLSAMGNESKRIQQAMLLFQAGISAKNILISSEVAAWNAMATVPYPANVGVAASIRTMGKVSATLTAAAGVFSAVNVSSGGGGSGGSVGVADSAPPSITDRANMIDQQPAASGGSVQIHIYNPELLSDQSISQLVDGISEHVSERDVMLVSPQSRNGQELRG